MDRTSELADAYVEVRFGDHEVQRTSVCRKTLNPTWGEDFRFEVTDDTQLQDEPVELKVFDYDAITADDSVGSVTVDLNPLLWSGITGQLAGWFPIYDTIRGTRGELWLQVKLEFFANANPFRDSSLGVPVFSQLGIPSSYTRCKIIGLVDAVITEVDPDYHWSDSFRTSRSSNEASQRILHQMSGRIRREMGRKALEMGGNAIVAYTQCIDIEPYAQTITLRALGTAVVLTGTELAAEHYQEKEESPLSRSEGNSVKMPHNDSTAHASAMKPSPIAITLGSKKIELTTIGVVPGGSVVGFGGIVSARSVKLMSEESEYGSAATRDRWLTELRQEIRSHTRTLGCNLVLAYTEAICVCDDLYILSAQGTACRMSRRGIRMTPEPITDDDGLASEMEDVLLDDGTSSLLGHKKQQPVSDIKRPGFSSRRDNDESADVSETESERLFQTELIQSSSYEEEYHQHHHGQTFEDKHHKKSPHQCIRRRIRNCQALHLPRRRPNRPPSATTPPQPPHQQKNVWCNICKRGQVPEMVLSTTEVPLGLEMFGRSELVEAFVCRPMKKKREAEVAATMVSSNLPFVEYELYRQLQFKMRYAGKNGLFGLKYHLVATDRLIVAVASGTGVCLAALPPLTALHITWNIAIKDAEDKQIYAMQERIANSALDVHAAVERYYAERFGGSLESKSNSSTESSSSSSSSSSFSGSSSDSDEEKQMIVQIDDEADEDLLLTIKDPEERSDEIILCGTLDQPLSSCAAPPSATMVESPLMMQQEQFICQFRRFAMPLDGRHPSSSLAREFARQYANVAAQLRGIFQSKPFVWAIRHQLNLVRGIEVQIVTTATVIGTVDDNSRHHQEPSDEPKQPSPTTAKASNVVMFSTSSVIPRNVFVGNCGAVTLQLFKEMYYYECVGGFEGFVAGTINDLFTMGRAVTVALGGNSLASVVFKPAAFYENFKNQLHVVLLLVGDVIRAKTTFSDQLILESI